MDCCGRRVRWRAGRAPIWVWCRPVAGATITTQPRGAAWSEVASRLAGDFGGGPGKKDDSEGKSGCALLTRKAIYGLCAASNPVKEDHAGALTAIWLLRRHRSRIDAGIVQRQPQTSCQAGCGLEYPLRYSSAATKYSPAKCVQLRSALLFAVDLARLRRKSKSSSTCMLHLQIARRRAVNVQQRRPRAEPLNSEEPGSQPPSAAALVRRLSLGRNGSLYFLESVRG
jgi:hypothetical protein